MKKICVLFASVLVLTGCSLCTKDKVNAEVIADASRTSAAVGIHQDSAIVERAPINDEGPGGGGGREHPPGPNCYRDC